jgi:signal transduction histidine kinase
MTSPGWEQQVREALASRDEFLSIAAHELRSPITALQLTLERLLRRAFNVGNAGDAGSAGGGEPGEARDEELIRSLGRALRQAERVSLLVQNLLDVSRIRTGRLELDREHFDLGSLVREVAESRKELAARVGSAISIKACDAAAGLWDRMRIEQVVNNLLSNAVKYGDGKPIEIELTTDGERVRLRVLDRGVGISEEDRERIFEPFERASAAWKAQSLGLGLYIVRAIVTAHEGSIRVESMPGEGAAFIVELPVKIELSKPSDGPGGDREQG